MSIWVFHSKYWSYESVNLIHFYRINEPMLSHYWKLILLPIFLFNFRRSNVCRHYFVIMAEPSANEVPLNGKSHRKKMLCYLNTINWYFYQKWFFCQQICLAPIILPKLSQGKRIVLWKLHTRFFWLKYLCL